MEINTAYLSLGSNIGDRLNFLQKAISELREFGEVTRCSRVYETPAWGFECDDHFLNVCLEFKTLRSPNDLLTDINKIENSLGRIRSNTEGYESRPIDIDIIFYNDLNIDTDNLTIPHPAYWKRNFVLVPLNDLVPEFTDHQLGKSVKTLLDELKDFSNIKCLQIPLIC